MGALEDFPLPSTAQHDDDGNHIPPYMREWRMAADPTSYAYDPNRVVRGREVERNEQQQRRFHEHLDEHRRRGEPAVVVEQES